MSFLALSPAMAGLLLAATGLAVAVLYWLKPPPRRVVVPSSLLWSRLLREKRRSTFLDRLRWWISLMIALAIGLSVATALGRPEMAGGDVPRRITVVLDNSATMATRMPDGRSRFEHGVAHARRLLRHGNAGGRYLIVDTSGQAPPTEPADRRAALDVLDRLEVSLGGDPQFPSVRTDDAELYFVSDGVMVSEVPAEAEIVSVFEPADNVGITAFEIRAVPAAPLSFQAFLEVTNASTGPKEVTVRVSGSGGSPLGETILLQAGESRGRTIDVSTFDRGPVRAAVTTDGDALAADDYAYAFLPVRNRTRIALISPGSVYLESALLIESRIDLTFYTPDDYSPSVAADVYVFDRYAPPAPPPGPALLFLPMDTNWLAPTVEILDSPDTGTWDRAHPVLRFVSLEDLRVDRAARTAPVDGSDILVGTRQMPLISTIDNPEKILRVAFALEDSNFPLQPGFPIFLSNALTWMMDEQVALAHVPGRIEVPLAGAQVVDLEGNEIAVWPLADRTVFVAPEPGLYTASRGTRRLRVAVNVADRHRSAVNDSSFGADQAAAAPVPLVEATSASWGDELWILLLTIATMLVVGEWFTYHRRLTV